MKTPREKVEFYLVLPVTTFRSLDSNNRYHVEIVEWPGCFAKGDTLAEAETALELAKRRYVETRLDAGQRIAKPFNSAEAERLYNTLNSIFINIALHTFEELGVDTDKIPGAISLQDIISGGIKLAVEGRVVVKVDTKPIVDELNKTAASLKSASTKELAEVLSSDDIGKAVDKLISSKAMPMAVVSETLGPDIEESFVDEPTDPSEPTEDAAIDPPAPDLDEPPTTTEPQPVVEKPATTEPAASETETDAHGLKSEFFDAMPTDIKWLENRRLNNGVNTLSSDEKLKLRRWKQAESARRRRTQRA